MDLALTSTEQIALLWDPGDQMQVLSGTISFTSKTQRRVVPSNPNSTVITTQRFFFESSDPSWGTKEWTMCMEGDIPNGPALLVTYRRGADACAWGIVSMVNRAWTHCMPLDSIDFAKGTGKGKLLSGTPLMIAIIIASLLFAIVTAGLGCGCLAILLFIPVVRQKAVDLLGLSKFKTAANEMTAAARALMYRISQNAELYWNTSGNSQTGKL